MYGRYNNIQAMMLVGVLLVGLMVVAVISCGTQPTAMSPVPVPRGGMVFVSDRDGNNEIYIMNADGRSQTNLTNSQMSEDRPVVSPDGNKILFSIMRSWPWEDNKLYVMNTDGTNRISLTSEYGTYIHSRQSWSSDSSRITYATNTDIYVVNADGSNQINLTNSGGSIENNQSPAWSPDGTKIFFNTHRIGDFVVFHGGNSEAYLANQEIYVMNADGSNQTNVTNSHSSELEPIWSPDGTKIIFLSFEPGKAAGEIYVINADGSNRTSLARDIEVNGPMAWSPDGTKIVFFTSSDGNSEIYIMNADGGNLIKLIDIPTWNLELAWSQDGRRIAFISYRDDNPEIYVIDADGSGLTNLTNNPAYDAWPAWLP